MATLMKLLAALVAIVSVIAGVVMMQKLPFRAGPDVLLPFVPMIVILVATLFALGEILAKLDIVLRSLDRPQVQPSAGAATDTTPAGRFAAGSAPRAVGNEPAL